MKTRVIDSAGDWSFGRGLQSYVSDLDALKQSISTRLKQWVGNCFFAIEEGVDWNSYLDIGQKNRLDLNIKRVIMQTAGVLKISSYESTINLDTRSATIVANITTIYGDLAMEETV
jgi:hypothetical protein